MNDEKTTQTLETARDFIKQAKKYANYKKTEGYNEDNYTLYEIVNLDACLEICDRGPADYYFEKAYDMLCKELGADHPETRQLVQDIINYHLDNIKRMMSERFFLTGVFLLPLVMLLDREMFGPSWQCNLVYVASYSLLSLSFYLETILLCYFEKQKYQKQYQIQNVK